uniref:GBF-interacting protein 1 N-terminal domain-containing protein n=1 Tax=Fagus sylvatica TaxID=28930 RepID=A0A2N9HYE9_FAGSY
MSGVAVLPDGNGNGDQGEGGSRVSASIPSNMRRTIQNIREITGKQHSDDDIYAVLKECSMDPNETAQKLLYLDTFHEVKRKRDRRKENLSSRKPEGSRFTQGRFARGGQDNGGGKNAPTRRENGINHITERGGSMPSSLPVTQKTKNNAASLPTKASAVIPNGPTSLSNGKASHGPSSQSSVNDVINVPEGSSAVDVNRLGAAPPQYAAVAALAPTGSAFRVKQGKSTSGSNQLSLSAAPATVSAVDSSVSDPVPVPVLSQHPGAVGTAKLGAGSQGIGTEPDHLQENKHLVRDLNELELSKNEKAPSRPMNFMNKKRAPSKSKAVQKNKVSEPSQPSSSASEGSLAVRSSSDCASQSMQESAVPDEVIASDVATTTVEVISQPPAEVNVNDRQLVTFPNHFQVSETLKSGLTFGSFDSTYGSSVKSISGTGGDNDSSCVVESSQGSGETAKEHSSNQVVPSDAQEDFPDHLQSISQPVLEKVPPPEGIVSGADTKDDQLKQEILSLPEGPQNPTIQNGPNYNIGLVSTMLGSQHLQFEGTEPQTHEASRFSNFVNGNTPALSSRSPTPPIQGSVPPQSVPVLRQPYPPNYFPYGGHYFHPYYMPPIPQYLSHNGFPQQPSTGNVYLTPAPAPGVKTSLPQLKPGTNAGNPAHIGLSFGGSFIAPPPVGYSPGSAVTSGSSTGIEDLSSSQMKENHVYTTGQLSEGSTVWIPGQDISNLPVNSLYNFPPHGQHMAFSPAQAGHGAFTGLYAGQTLAAPSTLLQQSQAMAGAVETVAPPSGVFQQPQHAQINWISNF